MHKHGAESIKCDKNYQNCFCQFRYKGNVLSGPQEVPAEPRDYPEHSLNTNTRSKWQHILRTVLI
jgi:hypothetical protein